MKKEFTVDRKTWLRGEADSYLCRRADEKMCCQGFYGLACGITKEKMWSVQAPHSLDYIKGQYPKELFRNENDATYWAILEINDDPEISDAYRETELKKLFLRLGITINFIN